jgi:hypothetical protein
MKGKHMELKRVGSQPSMKGPEACCGWTQCEGEAKVEIRAGDVIWCPPGHKHWHGATATTAMTHIAVQEALDGVNVVWLEKVGDADYLSPLGEACAHGH